MKNTTALQVQHISKSFPSPQGEVQAVQDVSFSIDAGEVVALLGENGAGKTTLVDIILGISAPNDGAVQLFSETPAVAIAQGRVGAILQTGGLLKDLTVQDQLNMVAATYSHPVDVQDVMQQAGITEIARRKINKCSGGQQQKVKFALALIASPQLLILDEPTTGMDVNAREEFWMSMKELAAKGTTIIFATHYLEEAAQFAERIIVMGHGKLLADQSIRDLRSSTGYSRFSFVLSPEDCEAFLSRSWHSAAPQDVVCEGPTIKLKSTEPEQFASELLQNFAIADLEIQKPSLDDIFKSLTHTA